MTDRQNDAAEAANHEADRLIAQAKAINSKVVVFLLLAAALLVGFNWPQEADAATKRVQVRYDVPAAQWNVKAAARDSGLRTKKVKRVKPSKVADCSKNCVVVFDVADRFEHDCNGLADASLKTRSVLVCKWGHNTATVMLSAPVAKTQTAAQRRATLTSALGSLR